MQVATERVRFKFEITTWGTALRNCRMGLDLSYKELADRVGVSKGVIKAWEHGEGYPTTAVQFKRLYASLRHLRPFENLLPKDQQAAIARDPAPEAPPSEPQPEPVVQKLDQPRTFGEALRLARQVEGLMQREVGDLLGVEQATVSTWELGTVVPIRSHYEKLLDLFEVLRDAPKPPVRDIEKPVGPTGMTLPTSPPRGPTRASTAGAIAITAGRAADPIALIEAAVGAPPPAAMPPSSALDLAGIGYARSLGRVTAARLALQQARDAVARAEADLRASEAAAATALDTLTRLSNQEDPDADR